MYVSLAPQQTSNDFLPRASSKQNLRFSYQWWCSFKNSGIWCCINSYTLTDTSENTASSILKVCVAPDKLHNSRAVTLHVTQAQKGGRSIVLPILNPDTKRGGWSEPYPYHWVGLRVSLDGSRKYHPTRVQTLACPAQSELLYQLSCTDPNKLRTIYQLTWWNAPEDLTLFPAYWESCSITLLLSHCRKLRTFSWYKKFITNLHKVKSIQVRYLDNNYSLTRTLVWPISRVMSRAHNEFHYTVHELRKVKCITDLLTSSFIFDIEKALYNTQLELTSLQRHRELTQTFTSTKFVGKWLSR